MLSKIRKGEYQYIFLSPKQLVSKDIRNIIRNCKNCIGIIGIDKLYLIYKQGDEFRLEYAKLKVARDLIRLDTVLVRASTTLAEDTIKKVQKLASFRKKGNEPFYLSILRSSIDRPDTTYILKNIPAGYLGKSQVLLYQLLKKAVDKNSFITLQNINKALCFIDSYESINKAVLRFYQQLIQITKDIQDPTKKYTIDSARNSYNIYKIVSFYTSYIATTN